MDNEKFEKPKSKEEAFKYIKKMSGKVNYAVTGVTIKDLYQISKLYFKFNELGYTISDFDMKE